MVSIERLTHPATPSRIDLAPPTQSLQGGVFMSRASLASENPDGSTSVDGDPQPPLPLDVGEPAGAAASEAPDGAAGRRFSAEEVDRQLPWWLAFNHVKGIGPARMDRLLGRYGTPEAAWKAPERGLADLLDGRTRAELRKMRRRLDLDRCLARLREIGAKPLVKGGPGYPDRLARLDRSPWLLYLRGDPRVLGLRGVAVVGTRKCSDYGRRAATQLSGDLARAGLSIVSGMALGIDTEAHRAAMDAGGSTTAVLGCGVDVAYPHSNRNLAQEIAVRGALISELPPGSPPLREHFPARNRIISGLSLATIVVEAGYKSGAVITARAALDQGRDVFAVPGEIFRKSAAGANQLLADGAGVALSADEVLAALDLSRLAEENAARRALPSDPAEAELIERLADGALQIDDLARAVDQPVAEVARRLTLMELKGMVRHVGGMRWMNRD